MSKTVACYTLFNVVLYNKTLFKPVSKVCNSLNNFQNLLNIIFGEV